MNFAGFTSRDLCMKVLYHYLQGVCASLEVMRSSPNGSLVNVLMLIGFSKSLQAQSIYSPISHCNSCIITVRWCSKYWGRAM